jgi:hypothetical protein
LQGQSDYADKEHPIAGSGHESETSLPTHEFPKKIRCSASSFDSFTNICKRVLKDSVQFTQLNFEMLLKSETAALIRLALA